MNDQKPDQAFLIGALETMLKTFENVDDEHAGRVIGSFWSMRGASLNDHGSRAIDEDRYSRNGDTAEPVNPCSYQTLGELINAANPGKEQEKALLAAYWVQNCNGGQGQFKTMSVSKALKSSGNELSNTTAALGALKKAKYIVQAGTLGSGSYKLWRVTDLGVQYINNMLEKQD